MIKTPHVIALILTIFVVSFLGLSAIDMNEPQKANTPEAEAPNTPSQQRVAQQYPQWKEIVNPGGYVNSDPFTIGEYIGKKVVLLDVMTYSCINCQRTFPYLNAWHEKYSDQGLQIIGIHTPEFAFERKQSNVEEAMERFGIKFPIVLDNEYGTWNAYGNKYWPRKYLIDIDGNIVYDHIGEGKYDEVEQEIQKALRERSSVLGDDMNIAKDTVDPEGVEDVQFVFNRSPETYLGSLRQTFEGNSAVTTTGDIITFVEPTQIKKNTLYLAGDWRITGEYAEAAGDNAKIIFHYTAQKVFLVMSSEKEATLEVRIDGKSIAEQDQGIHVSEGTATIQNEQLYRLIEHEDMVESGVLELEVGEGIRAFAFTFG